MDKAIKYSIYIMLFLLVIFLGTILSLGIQKALGKLAEDDSVDQTDTKQLKTNEVYESIDKYLKDSMLSMDVDDQKNDSSTKYQILFSYDRDIERSKLVLIDSTNAATTVQEFTNHADTLVTNYSLPAYEYKNYLIFSIDPKIFGCSKDDGSWCPGYLEEIRSDAQYAGIYRLDLNTGELKKLLKYDSHTDDYKKFVLLENTPNLMIVTDNEDRITIELLQIETTEIQEIEILEKTED